MEFPTEKEEEKFCLARRTVAYLSCTFPQFCVPWKKLLGFCPGGPASFFTEFLLSRQTNVRSLIFVFNMEENEIFCRFFPHFVPLHGEAGGSPAAISTSVGYPKIYEVGSNQNFWAFRIIISTDAAPGPDSFINKPKN
jgi:hypothetical protein